MVHGVKSIARHAIRVMEALGKGHTESVYHKALIASLNDEGVPHRSEVFSPILFLGQVVGVGRCDLIVGNMIIELKAVTRRPTQTSHQVKKYMSSLQATERVKYHGVIINFNQQSGRVDIVEEINPDGMLAKLRRNVHSRKK